MIFIIIIIIIFWLKKFRPGRLLHTSGLLAVGLEVRPFE